MSTLATIAFDIETTGFSTTDQLTVVGFDAEIGSRERRIQVKRLRRRRQSSSNGLLRTAL